MNARVVSIKKTLCRPLVSTLPHLTDYQKRFRSPELKTEATQQLIATVLQ